MDDAEFLDVLLRGQNAFADGRVGDAKDLAIRILKARPDQPDALHLLAQAAHVWERPKDSLNLTVTAAAKAPHAAVLRVALATYLEALDRLPAAAASLRRALTLDPARADAWSGLAALLKGERRFAAAGVAYARAARLEPANPFPNDNALLCAYLATGHPPAGLSWRDGAPPRVAVVIPCFNYGRYVAEAVDSALAQTWENLDVVVVDGGSTDGETPEILKKLDRPRTRIFLRDGRHLVGDNRNFGIAAADAPYVCCLDADDLLDPDYVERAMFFLDALGYDVVSSQMRYFGASSARPRWPLARLPTLDLLLRNNQVATAAVFRRSCWAAAGGFQDAGLGADYIYEDWRLWTRMAAMGARMLNMDERLFLYRAHDRPRITTQQGMKSLAEQAAAIRAFNADVLPGGASSGG